MEGRRSEDVNGKRYIWKFSLYEIAIILTLFFSIILFSDVDINVGLTIESEKAKKSTN
jgi:hypothetical protein